jgi:hypothetical protein
MKECTDCPAGYGISWNPIAVNAVRLLESGKTMIDQTDSNVSFCKNLTWHHISEGIGTAGKDDDGKPLWFDGDRVLVIVETNIGREIAAVRIDCDVHFFHVYDSDEDDFGWMPDSWEWWAKLDKTNLP